MKCLTCKHCEIDFGIHHYSDLTPGSPGEWICRKGKWDIDDESCGDGKRLIERAFAIGETCDVWESDGRITTTEGKAKPSAPSEPPTPVVQGGDIVVIDGKLTMVWDEPWLGEKSTAPTPEKP